MKEHELTSVVRGIAPAIKEFVSKMLAGSTSRLASLEARMVALEAAPRIHYRGVWEAGSHYAEGATVTHKGGLWIALENDPPAEPGDGVSGWQLAVKRGRDGRNADRR